MKNVKYFLILITVFGCNTSEILELEELSSQEVLTKRVSSSQESEIVPPEYLTNELVVKYAPHITTEQQRSEIRQRYKVQDFIPCSCDDREVETWEFSDDIVIEDMISDSRDEPDLDGVDFQYIVKFFNEKKLNAASDFDHLKSMLKPQNDGVTIAILDSGLDYTYEGFTEPFLYNHSGEENECEDLELFSGWDFVNIDNDVMDDNGHGTIVTYTAFTQLNKREVNFNILPVKVFDLHGKSNTHRITCGLRFAKKHGANIINMSFGWDVTNIGLISTEIQSNTNAIHVSSAGNNSRDVDNDGAHFPSNSPFDNVIAVAGMSYDQKGDLVLWPNSNFGNISIDIAAFAEVKFHYNNQLFQTSGTSYAVPIVVGKAAELYQNGTTFIPALNAQIIVTGAVSQYLSINNVLANNVYVPH